MREKKRCLALAAALVIALVLPAAANAHPSPEECTGSGPKVTFAKETLEQFTSPVREGDEIVLAVNIDNRDAAACDLSDIKVEVGLPEVNGSSEEFLLIHNVKLSAGAAVKAVNHDPYVVALDPGVFEASLEIRWSATVHDGTDDSAISGKGSSAGFSLTRPVASLVVTPDKTAGEPPLTVNFTYELTNISPSPAGGLPAPRLVPGGLGKAVDALTDGNCEPLNVKLGDMTDLIDPGLDPGEKWTFSCSRTFSLPGTYTSLPSINAKSSTDGRAWPQVAADGAPVTVLGSDLTVDKSHQGDFLAGSRGEYSLKVSNGGNQATRGEITVSDQLPEGLSATRISGRGWSCDLASVSCMRSDPLQSGASYPEVTVKVRVADNPPASVINTASVSGGGEPEAATSNNSDSDPTSIRTSAQPTPPAGRIFRVGKVTTVPDGSVKIKVTVPGAGLLVADDAKKRNLVRRTTKNVGKARTISILVKANRRLKRQLRNSGKPRKVKVRISFAAKGSPENVTPISAVRTVFFGIR